MSDEDITIVRPPAAPRAPGAPVRTLPMPARFVDPEATVLRRTRLLAQKDDPDATVILSAQPAAPQPDRPLPRAPQLALAPGFRLLEYRIERVLGQGGFGITYLATDVNLNSQVAIKEYLPEEIAFRAGDRSVSPNASRHRDRYREGLESFLVEARTLAAFRHPAIVRVARFFEAHRTAYMVLEYEQGAPFKTWWPPHAAALGEQGLVELLLPLLDGLAAVHGAGFLHRDIKPDNIQVRAADGRLVLLDFGSAGQTVAVADQGAVALTPGYAPIEQYGLGQQGPWTDVYAFAATLYWAVTGHKPPDAEMRAANPRSYLRAVDLGGGRFGAAFLQAIDWALQADPHERPQTMLDFRRALCADHVASLNISEALQRGDTVIDGEAQNPTAPRTRWHTRTQRTLRLRWRPRDWPLAWKLALAMVATALLPMLMTSAYNQRDSLAALSGAELRYVEQMAHSTAGRVAQFIADSRNLTRALATDAVFVGTLSAPDAAALPALSDKLKRLTVANPDVQLMLLMDAAGNAVSSSDPAVQGKNFAFRQYFQVAMTGKPFATGLVVGAVAGASGMVFAEPVRDATDRVVGVFALRMRGTAVAAIVDEVRHDSTLTSFLIDGDGVIIHHPKPELLYRSLMPLPADALAAIRADQRFRRNQIHSLNETELAAAMVDARRSGTVSYRSVHSGQAVITGYAPVAGHDWIVGVSEPRASFEAPLQRLTTTLLWSVALVGLLFTGLALRFARRIVMPIRGLTAAANALKAGDYAAAAVKVDSRDEVGQLGRTFNVMIDVLRQRERERRRD
jgi:serine/threonine protein kinase/HAMP domain-containing protein